MFDARIVPSFGMTVSGPPMSGKSTFVLDMLNNAGRLMTREFDYVVWFYGEKNKTVEIINREHSDKIRTVSGLPENIDDYILERADDGQEMYGCHIYDDLMQSSTTADSIVNLATTKCQHRRISWVLILQDLFFQSKNRVTLLRCAHYQVLFNNPLDKSIAEHAARKIMPKNQKLFITIYEKATDKPNGYLFIDGGQKTPSCARLRTDIFEEVQRVYVTNAKANDCKGLIVREM